ncbi:acyltransferase family protein [Crassaminicella profunda]|uniref:acyltransferase family protein n=1 Tax=Crassaminicella profunda TaxID=1286698 RepID=UPI001CA762A9|nr:acyltransferase [Crassaminicella profunda]QZY55336.1 acyltransferase [Crassaminicella profunda]
MTEQNIIKEHNKLEHIILLKIFAILIVVLGHSTLIYNDNWTYFIAINQSKFFHYLKEYINTFQMPLFVFISGYLYYFTHVEQCKYNTFKILINKKIKKLVVPYLCIGLIWVVPIRYFVEYENYRSLKLIQVIFTKVLVVKDVGHLWFLIMLFNIFVIFYFLEKLIKKQNAILVLFLLLGLAIISYKIPSIFQLKRSFYYLLFFYFGYIFRLKTKEIKLLVLNKQLLITFFLVLLNIMGFYIKLLSPVFAESSIEIKIMLACLKIINGFSGTILFYVIIFNISCKYKGIIHTKYIRLLADKTFQIYLFHEPYIYIIFFYLGMTNIHPALLVSISFLGSICISLIMDYLFSRLYYLKFMLGK